MQFETTKTLVRTDKNGTKIYNVIRPCYRCGGRGILNCYMHVEAGTCFACNGTGREEATEKEYTEEYLERKAARAKAKEDARIAGTIKEHSEFRGEKQTVLTRCKVIAA